MWVHEIFDILQDVLWTDHYLQTAFQDFSKNLFFFAQVSVIPVSYEMPSFVPLILGLEQYLAMLNFANISPRNLVILQILIGFLWAWDSAFVKGSQGNADFPGPQSTIWAVGIQAWPVLDMYALCIPHVLKCFEWISVKQEKRKKYVSTKWNIMTHI